MKNQLEQSLRTKNAELEKELAAKNRDLEIEASLQRVRARTLAMQQSSELAETAYVLYQQFAALGEKPLQITIGIIDAGKHIIEFWATDLRGNKTEKTAAGSLDEPFLLSKLYAAWKNNEKSAMIALSDKELEGWVRYREQISGLTGPDGELQGTRYVYFGYFSKGAISISTDEPLPAETVQILERFAGVFDGTYTRFLDLQKAEAQARESQIELALERVRARTMAMYHSEELAETAAVLFEQLSELGNEPARISIGIMDQEKGVVNFWATDQEGDQINISFTARLTEKTTISKMYAGWQAKLKSLSIELKGKELAEWVRFCRQDMGIIIRDELLQKRRVHTVGYFPQGWINYTTHTTPSSETTQILERFATMFSYTYTRFLDLQKAEAQARESQIELALERVRARTMAMQKSGELKEIIKVVYEQLVHLNILAEHAGFIMDYRANDDMHIWLADKHFDPSYITVPYFDSPHWNSFNDAKEKGTDFFANLLPFEEKNKFYRDLFALVPGVTDEAKEYYFSCPGLAGSTVLLENIGLYIENFSGIPYTDEENNTLMRFGTVFQQTYTRFLDLQKAEGQAREGQIQLGLERVRASAMAMHNSKDVSNATAVMFSELSKLDIVTIRSGVLIIEESTQLLEVWAATSPNAGKVSQGSGKVDINKTLLWQNIFKCWKQKKVNLTYELAGQELVDYYEAQTTSPDYRPPQLNSAYTVPGDPTNARQYCNLFFFAEGAVFAFTEKPFDPATNHVLEKFARVFGLTYRRYLDLTKAEAQTREAQIELSLERVRAKTMAMHTSEHVGETVAAMFDELVKLGIENTARCGISIITDNQEMELWRASYNPNGEVDMLIGRVDMTIHPLLKEVYQAWKNKQAAYTYELTGEDQESYFRALNNSPDYAAQFDLAALPAKQTNSVFFFPEGCVYVFTLEPLSEDAVKLVRRFAGVFGLTYRRFLDLQKAEAQARQAQIEVAMEKVRSRSLAMQKPEELVEVAQVLRQEMALLGVEELETCSIYIHHEATGKTECWYAIKDEHKLVADHMNMNLEDTWVGRQMLQFYHSDKTQISIPMKGENRKEWINYCSTKSKLLDGYYGDNIPDRTYHINKFSDGYMGAASPGDISAESWELLQRATAVFSFAYIRFSDLQQAEAQAMEARIEAALERVRSRTMGMQKSAELAAVIQVLYEQLVQLGFEISNAGFLMDFRETDDFNLWMADAYTAFPIKERLPYIDHPQMNCFKEAKAKGLDFLTYSLTLEEKNKWFEYCFTILDVPVETQPVVFECAGLATSAALLKNVSLYLLNYSGVPYSEAENTTLMRFGKVFEQTYTRFKDLEQAEEQAKESQIQLALERVRAKTMAMQKSDELPETSSLLFQQVKELGEAAIQNSIAIVNEKTGFVELSTTVHGSHLLHTLHVPIDDPHVMAKAVAAWKAKRKSLTLEFKGQELKNYNELRNSFLETKINFPDDLWVVNISFFSKGWLSFSFNKNVSDEIIVAQKRFAAVFDQTYTRFLDLQKAEAQSREAQIELALERVRARTMAMQKSEELQEVIQLVFDQLHLLNFDIDTANFALNYNETKDLDLWLAVAGTKYATKVRIPYFNHVVFDRFNKAKKKGGLFTDTLSVDQKNSFFEHFFKHMPGVPEERKAFVFEGPGFARSAAFMKNTVLTVINYRGTPYSEVENNILLRFGHAFDQTYTRFNDLKLAEEQAREAKIEASLERVRGKAMAMRNSEDLSVTASMVFTELRNLGINPIRSGVGLITKETRRTKIYSDTSSQKDTDLSLMGEVILSGNPVFEQQYQAWLKQENYFVALEGNELASYYKILSAGLNADLKVTGKTRHKEFGHWFMFSEGFLYAWSDKSYTEAEIKILERFKNVIELTFRRYIELQKSEAIARDAVKEASLDRVRAEIASMRSTNDLDRITPLIWNELTILGIPFIRCGVFIIDEEEQLIHTHLSTADGKGLATFDLKFDSGEVVRIVVPAWREKQIATHHWSAEEFATFTKNLVDQGTISSKEKYVTEHPHTSLDLHFLPFLQGMLYVGNTRPLTEDETDLVQSLADAFSTAYARYEDFSKLEAAKKQVENTLADLKATQTRLIQSEKMASLGELTAGIAHEIQNPLNFVNNFSEVNQEMIDELAEELKAGNIEEALAIAADIKDNEQKISHHGKRADGIVKGMLQHSRTGGGEKQPTSMNVLADEFMRLSYHGLRAKDKTFNSEMITHFQPDLPKIMVIPQDIGRVLLNLFNNAFYAVNQKQKKLGPDYKPEVIVTTSSENGQVAIKVKDNGIGIPDVIKEKIMQPFFTTKPTGEGTGLGLSLTYDMVVKGHGGIITVESIEGEGSEFMIKLPS